jgi:NAD(P)-dependent dehydrogenase (short-subunit alcohol dehydrogenase family)
MLADIDEAELSRRVEELRGDGYEAHARVVDVTSEREVRGAVDDAARLLGGLDAIVANAGVLSVAPFEDIGLDDFRRTLEINLIGTFLTLQCGVAQLRRAGGGSMVCVASQAGLRGGAQLTAYCASKFGVIGLVESLATELGPEGIAVSAVAPGLVNTPMLESFFTGRAKAEGTSPEIVRESAIADIPLGRLAAPSEVAEAIAFLISAPAMYASGATVALRGGEP